MKILNLNNDGQIVTESVNLSTLQQKLNDVENMAQFNKGPGYENISGAHMCASLDMLLKKLQNDVYADKLSDISDRKLAGYLPYIQQSLYLADELSQKAAALNEAAKNARDIVKAIKSALEDAADTHINLG